MDAHFSNHGFTIMMIIFFPPRNASSKFISSFPASFPPPSLPPSFSFTSCLCAKVTMVNCRSLRSCDAVSSGRLAVVRWSVGKKYVYKKE